MKKKYFILALTFLCLLVGQTSYSQDWGDIEDTLEDWADQGVDIDYYTAEEYVDMVNNDDNTDNDIDVDFDDNSGNVPLNDYNGESIINNELVTWTTDGTHYAMDNLGNIYADMDKMPDGTLGNGIFDTGEVIHNYPGDVDLSGGNDDNSPTYDDLYGDLTNPYDYGDPDNESEDTCDYYPDACSSTGTDNTPDTPDVTNVDNSLQPGFGDAIFSLSGDYKATGNQYSKNIYIETSPGNYYRLDRFKLNTDNIVPLLGPDKNEENRKLIDKIVTYYAQKIGITTEIVIDSTPFSDEKTLAYSTLDKIHIAINKDGNINSLLSNFNNLLSVLYHEELHIKDKRDGKTTTYYSHTEIYIKQCLNGPDFSKTTYEFQKGQIGSLVNYLYNIPNSTQADNLIKYFNENSKDWKIGTTGYRSGYGYPIYYKGNELYVPTEILTSPN